MAGVKRLGLKFYILLYGGRDFFCPYKIYMKIPNYDSISESDSDYRQLLPYMPSNTFRMLICGASGCGKTNTLMHMLYNLLYFDKIYLFSKNLQQPKYRKLLETFEPISEEAGYDVIEESNDEIIPLDQLDNDNQKIVIFDDFVKRTKIL